MKKKEWSDSLGMQAAEEQVEKDLGDKIVLLSEEELAREIDLTYLATLLVDIYLEGVCVKSGHAEHVCKTCLRKLEDENLKLRSYKRW